MSKEAFINVLDFDVYADGIHDDTAAFQKAVNAAEEKKLELKIPNGTYLLTDTITVKEIPVIGQISGAWCADHEELPKFIIYHDNGPAFSTVSSTFAGIHISYDKWYMDHDQTPAKQAAVYVPYGGLRVSNVKITNAWNGIECDDHLDDREGNPGRMNVENVFMRDIHNIGMYMGGTLDVDCIRNVEVWSPGSKTFPQTGIGFYFMKNDGIHLSDCFAFNAHIGFLFDEQHSLKDFNGGSLLWMSNCNVDYSHHGIVIRGREADENDTEHYYPTQLSINGGSFWCHYSGLKVESGDCKVTASSAEFRSNGSPAVEILGGDNLTLGNCFILRDFPYEVCPAINVKNGNNLILTGCVIRSHGDAFQIDEGAKNIIVQGCVVEADKKAYVDNSNGTANLKTCNCIVNEKC